MADNLDHAFRPVAKPASVGFSVLVDPECAAVE
jgi:hypothetical protein